MKRRNLIDEYRAAGYPEASLECLYYLESRTEEHLDRFLERYRHLRPIGKLFSPEMLGMIRELTALEEYLAHLEEMIVSQSTNPSDSVPSQGPLWDF
jgi:hypothetical protein